MLPPELLRPIVIKAVVEYLDDVIAGPLAIPLDQAVADEQQPPAPELFMDFTASPMGCLLAASFQLRQVTLEVLSVFLGLKVEKGGAGRLASSPWMVIQAVRLVYAGHISLLMAPHKAALADASKAHPRSLLLVYIPCAIGRMDNPIHVHYDAIDKIFEGNTLTLSDACTLLEHPEQEFVHELEVRIDEVPLVRYNRLAPRLARMLRDILLQYSEQVEQFQRLPSQTSAATDIGALSDVENVGGAADLYEICANTSQSLRCALTITKEIISAVQKFSVSRRMGSADDRLTESIQTVGRFVGFVLSHIQDTITGKILSALASGLQFHLEVARCYLRVYMTLSGDPAGYEDVHSIPIPTLPPTDMSPTICIPSLQRIAAHARHLAQSFTS